MKLLVFGRNGQLAQAIASRVPADVTLTCLGRDQVNLAQLAEVQRAIATLQPDAVCNAAAWTAVDAAEQAQHEAQVINGDAPGVMAQTCARLGIPMLQVSTDYVFDGMLGRPYEPDDATGPLNAYGRSKLAGERAVQASGARHVVLRTSWVVSATGRNFVTTVLRLAREGKPLRVVSDQIGGLTPADALADACLVALRALVGGHAGGTYHFSGAPDASWAMVARSVLGASGLAVSVEDITTAEYGALAARPLDARLACGAFERDFGVGRPDWRAAMAGLVGA
jgi:dTDP-4-dehydrorhamnose reductase